MFNRYMDNVTTPPPAPPKKESGFGKTAERFKHASTLTGSTVKLLFNIVLAVFLVTVIGGMFGGEAGQTYQQPLFGDGDDQIAVINLSGTILDTAPSSPLDTISDADIITPRKILLLLEDLKKETQVKAVILRINSPGGSVTASDEIYHTIKRFREETDLPVIASLSEVAASGGYYIALGADTIIASPTTITGSIGVIANAYNIKELADRYGVKEISITSGNNKNFLSPFQEPSAEEQAILKSLIDEAYAQFLSLVADSRKINQNSFIGVADGRPLSGKQAMEYKLVDRVGGFYESVQYVRATIGSPDAQVVEYGKGGLFDNLLGAAVKPFTQSHLRPLVILQQFSNKPAYLYMPF